MKGYIIILQAQKFYNIIYITFQMDTSIGKIPDLRLKLHKEDGLEGAPWNQKMMEEILSQACKLSQQLFSVRLPYLHDEFQEHTML